MVYITTGLANQVLLVLRLSVLLSFYSKLHVHSDAAYSVTHTETPWSELSKEILSFEPANLSSRMPLSLWLLQYYRNRRSSQENECEIRKWDTNGSVVCVEIIFVSPFRYGLIN